MASPSASFDLEVPPPGTEVDPDDVQQPVGAAVLAVLAAAACWAFIGIAYRLILDRFDVSPLGVVAIRASTSALVLTTVILLRARLRQELRIAAGANVRGPLLLAGILSGTGFYVALIYTFEFAGVAVGTVLLYFAPSIVAFGAWVIFRDRITRLQQVALVCSLLGIIAVSGLLAGGETFRAAGVALGLVSAICYASYSLLGQVLLRSLSPMVVVALTGVVGSVGIWILKVLVEGPSFPSLEATLWIAGVTGVGTTLAPLMLYTWGLSKLGAARASLLTTIEPVIAVALAFVILNETLTAAQIGGGVLVVASVVLAGLERATR